MELNEIRTNIDLIDDQMLDLFLKRMALSAQVAVYKAERNLPIYVPEREQQILEQLSQKAGADMAQEVKTLYETIFQLSREYQARKNQK